MLQEVKRLRRTLVEKYEVIIPLTLGMLIIEILM